MKELDEFARKSAEAKLRALTGTEAEVRAEKDSRYDFLDGEDKTRYLVRAKAETNGTALYAGGWKREELEDAIETTADKLSEIICEFGLLEKDFDKRSGRLITFIQDQIDHWQCFYGTSARDVLSWSDLNDEILRIAKSSKSVAEAVEMTHALHERFAKGERKQ